MSQVPINIIKQNKRENTDELSMINEVEIKPKITRTKTLNPIGSPVKELKRDDAPTTITINQEPVTHLKQHPINRAL